MKKRALVRLDRFFGSFSQNQWGDRYWSRIPEGEPPDGGEAGEEADVPPTHRVRHHSGKRLAGRAAAADDTPAYGVRPRSGKRASGAAFFRLFLLPAAPAPG
ncbi:MAG: hypothetical protein LBO04_03710 [Spirochaetaceae bacterium]|jgi:hypothetical protein|nr:hypothetical protein [Spirochaetaceae bacterium]